jgi:type II secretory pathway component PulF
VRDSIERGGGMEGPLRKSAPAIPHVMTDMIVTGEESGKVDEVCEQIADIYEEEVEIETRSLGEALQPIFTVIVGIGVMILFVALFLPLITSLDSLSGSGV